MDAFSDITTVLNRYFDTLYYCDLDKFDKVFHERAIYITADESPTLCYGMGEYRKIIAQRESPSSRQEPRKDCIDGIELAGENTARARVRCAIGSRNFVDFLTLIREGGQWKIIAKVFQIIEK